MNRITALATLAPGRIRAMTRVGESTGDSGDASGNRRFAVDAR